MTAPSVGSVSGGECDAVAALHALASALDLAAAGVSAGLSSLASLPLLSASAALAALALALSSAVALALAAAARQRLGVSARLALLAWPRRPCWLGRPSSIAQLAEERGFSKMS